MSSVGDLSTECKLSVILEKRPRLIEQLALCLDREMRFIPNWRQLATDLDVDMNVIKRLGQYSDYSPTIRLFEFLEVTQPDLTIKQLKDALLEIRRNDLFSLLSTKAGCIDSEKVKDIITSRNIQAPSPTAGLLDEIALALDVTSLVLSSWSNLAIKLGVPRKTCWEFERRSTDDPTHNLLRYLVTTCPEIKLKSLKDALDSMKRKDVLKILQEQNQGDEVFLKDVMAQKPELVETMAENLNREEVPGVKNWIHLASKLNVPDDVRQELGATEKKRKSPTKEVIQWVAVNLPEKTLSDVANALDMIQRNDAIQIISMQFPDTVESTLERLRCSPQDSFRVPDPTGHNLSTSDNWKEKISLPKEVADVREHSGHCGTLPDQIDLVGRNETCERIITALSSNKAVEIVAPPGYGKTSVVIEVAHRLINRGKFIAYVNPRGVTCVEDLASDIIEALGFVPSEDTIAEAIRRIRALKTKSTVLLIENIDNLLHLEAQVRKDECLRELNSKNYCTKMRGKFTKDEFLSFLKDIGKCPTIHLVLTSREFYNFRLSFPTELIDLEPLKDSDSATLFKKCDDSLEEGSINDLVRVCGGIPLIICTVPSILRRENPERFTQRLTSCSPQTLLKLLSPDFQASEDRIDRCLQICFDRFSKENQKIFVMFSTFPKGFTEEQFDACFKSLIGGDLQTFPICLKQSSLLNFDKNNCLYSLHPFIRDFFSSMPEHKEAKSVFLRHYSNLIVSLCKKFLSADKKSAINRYRSEKDNIREAMVLCGDHPELEQTVREHCVAAFNDAAVFLAKMMRKQEFVSLFCKFAYRCQRDRHLLSACLTNIGVKIVLSCTCRPYICPRALYQAKRFLARAKQIHSELTNVNEAIRAHCLSKLGFCCVREGHFGEGYDYLNEAIALRTKREKKSDETKDKVMLGACFNDIAASQMVQRKHMCAIQTRLCYVLPLYEQNLGEHPFTATTLDWIGNSYHAIVP
ncbi:uncharacterized protein [Pocillopora verrucosa]|uniref:uncharacterized protein isoform X2 n=1 Tax=Pocillopora verrucosa TaxID=203993 RepID=UPI00333F74EE